VTLGQATSSLHKKIRELVEGGSKRILLNRAEVSYIDSAGIGELIAAYTTVSVAEGEMKLLNLANRAHDLLQITKLCTYSRHLRTRLRRSAVSLRLYQLNSR
jgi:anti-sigma B factor antagonist